MMLAQSTLHATTFDAHEIGVSLDYAKENALYAVYGLEEMAARRSTGAEPTY